MTDSEAIKKHHKSNLAGIIDILRAKGTLMKWPLIFSLVVSFLVMNGTIFFYPQHSFDYLRKTVELMLSFFPNLLGFSLGGYALVVGFGNLDLIKAGSKLNGYSVYQKLNAIFSLCIFLQVLTTTVSFIVNWLVVVNPFMISEISVGVFGIIMNAFILFFILFVSLYSLLLSPYVIINLFTLSQVNSSFLTIQKLTDKRKQVDDKKDGD